MSHNALTGLLSGGLASISMDSHTLSLAGMGLVVVFVVSKVMAYRDNLKRVGHLPGYRLPLFPYTILGMMFKNSNLIPGYQFLWNWRSSMYKRFKQDTISYISWFSGRALIFTSNVEVMRQVAGGTKSDFIKPAQASEGILIWGSNILASEGGEHWRAHRRIMAPAFSQGLYELLWKTSISLYRQMLAGEGWETKKVAQVSRAQDFTYKFALLTIGVCGFGFHFNWTDPMITVDGDMTLTKAFEIFDHNQVLVLLPWWLLRLPIKRFKEYRRATAKLTEWMVGQIAERKELINSRTEDDKEKLREDLFTRMVKANEEELKKFRLADQELIGNIFIILLAGHETTAQTLAATLAQLALHPEIQDEIFEQIISVVGLNRDPDLEDYRSLTKVLAAFYEGTRMYPAGHIMFRQAQVDTILHVENPVGETPGTTPVPLPKGANIVVDVIGVQYNERYFEEPFKFKISRWADMPHESEAASAFSVGPRACIGRKFAATEAVAFLTMMLRDWKIEPLLEAGETLGQWEKRVFQGNVMLSLGIQSASLKFVRRERS
ncbi:cytochrome P450 [Coprinopsis marcescibilis]|uniref:Cytochrome P450 n=1 Tax=Coprinopsis marcescibilis TaxID=230819 RepID=A0A5C3L7W8_COPMA|nr:cytochrome P450 [Coprinopsis marcescibilis]